MYHLKNQLMLVCYLSSSAYDYLGLVSVERVQRTGRREKRKTPQTAEDLT